MNALGQATISPATPVTAGQFGTWTIVYVVGALGIDSGGQIKISRRLVSDWGDPQFDDPEAEGYTTVSTTGTAKIRPSWQPRGYIRPFSPAIVLDIYDGSLAPGDLITITLGDRSYGAPGILAQTFVESAFEFRLLVDPTNSTDPRPITDRLTLQIVADEIDRLICLLPSQGIVGRPVEIFLKGEDRWRNPTPPPEFFHVDWVGSGDISIGQGGLTAHTPAEGFVAVTAGRFTCRSNPIVFSAAEPALKRFWGDLHAQTGATVGVGSEDEYFSFGRDIARLDFMSHQGNDFQISDTYWDHLNHTTQKFQEEGRFVVFPGYEWSSSTPTGGDHNVIYRREGLPILRSSHWLVPDTPDSDLSPAHPADVFYQKLKQAVSLDEVLVCQHVGGRYANLRQFFDEELISLVEISSVWGVFEWMLWDAIDRGYEVGVMCNSDGHHGRPGAEGAGMTEFGIESGLTCVLAEALTREAVFFALKNRRCYGTTGPRMLLDFSINGRPMGSALSEPQASLAVRAAVTGTAPLESLQLYRGRELISEVRPPEFDDLSASNLIRVTWQGSRERGRQRRVTWDGTVRMEGCRIKSVKPVSFDVISDGVRRITFEEVVFASKTTGDRDILEIQLDDASRGTLRFESAAGEAIVKLTDLTAAQPRQVFDFGGVDMQVTVERYPAGVHTLTLQLEDSIVPVPRKKTPFLIKAIQIDGHMAWASPIWVPNFNNKTI